MCKPNLTGWLGIGPFTKQSLGSTQMLGMIGPGNNAGPKLRTFSNAIERYIIIGNVFCVPLMYFD